MKLRIVALPALVLSLCVSAAQAALIESFENTDGGWTIAAGQPTYSFNGFSTTQGVTEGTYAAKITGTASPTYGVLLSSPSTNALTSTLSTATQLLIDVEIETPGDFGFFLQWEGIINNADLGYEALDGFSFGQAFGSGSATLMWDITPAQRAVLASSAAASQIVFQVGGGTDGDNTMIIDNVRVTTIPEPSAICLTFLALAGMVRARKR